MSAPRGSAPRPIGSLVSVPGAGRFTFLSLRHNSVSRFGSVASSNDEARPGTPNVRDGGLAMGDHIHVTRMPR